MGRCCNARCDNDRYKKELPDAFWVFHAAPALARALGMRTLSADVGGTFTDLVLIDAETGSVHLDKVPSTPGRADAVLEGIKRITGKGDLSASDIDLFVHGFTVATNALLTRSGANVAMVTTQGFRDVLEIGDQMRPHLYHLTQTQPRPVVPRSRIVEVGERVDAFGKVVTVLDEDRADAAAEALAALEPDAVAVCLAFSYLDSTHEEMIERAVNKRLSGVPVYLSSRVNPQIEEYPRANTTAIAAYVGPVVERYVSNLDQSLAGENIDAPLRLMRSDGGVATPEVARRNPATMLLSGPAGGVIAGAALSADLAVSNLVTFDMGGTSADFSVITDGEPRMVNSRLVNEQPLRLPTLDIETISAGGGSIAHVDLGGGLKVGPDSAGAEPGPACYGQGGVQPTLTDAAVVLGILDRHEFLGGEMNIEPPLARAAIKEHIARALDLSVEEAALGIIRVANAGMIQTIRKISVECGLDIRDFALLAFGGAGPIYAPFMADELGMAEVLVPLSPGVYAAQGLLMSDIRHTAQTTYQKRVAKIEESDISSRFTALATELDRALSNDGIAEDARRFRYAADMRCVGQFHELTVPFPSPDRPRWWEAKEISALFHRHHERTYGHADESIAVEIINLRVEAFGETPRSATSVFSSASSQTPPASSERDVYLDSRSGFQPCAVYQRHDLRPGHAISGPALVAQRDTTTLVLAGQNAKVSNDGVLRISIGSAS